MSYLEICAEDNTRSSIGNFCNSSLDNSPLFYGCTQLADRHVSCSEGFGSESGSSNSGQSPSISNIDINVGDVQGRAPEGKQFLVCHYLKGAFNKIKPVPKYDNIWSVDIVLDYLSLFLPVDEIDLKELTLKLVMLIALTTGQRSQTLPFVDISEQSLQRNETYLNFALTEHLNQDKRGKVFANVCLYRYHVKVHCVYETLNYYITTTVKLKNSTKLLVSFIKPHGAVTSSAIGRWIKIVLGQAGIDTRRFSGYTTRCASTGKALLSVSTDVRNSSHCWLD